MTDRDHDWPEYAVRLDELLIRLLDRVHIIDTTTNRTDRKANTIMADLTGLQAAAAQIQTDVTEAIAALDDLKAKLDEGGTVSQADLDAVTAQLTEAGSNLDAAVATDDPPAPPA